MESWCGLKSSHPSLDALQTILKQFFMLLTAAEPQPCPMQGVLLLERAVPRAGQAGHTLCHSSGSHLCCPHQTGAGVPQPDHGSPPGAAVPELCASPWFSICLQIPLVPFS